MVIAGVSHGYRQGALTSGHRTLVRASCTERARFSVGMVVEFTIDGGRTLRRTIVRLKHKTATVITGSAQSCA